MKKIITTFLFLGFFAILQAADFTGVKIYINPGHGGWDANDRNIQTINHALGDTLGFYESKSNLIKGLHLRDLLHQSGATVYMSRTLNRSDDDRVLSQIAEEANANGVDAFISIHSNAFNATSNYLLLLFHGPDNAPVVSQSQPMCQAAWPRLMSNKLTVWTNYTTSTNIRGDHSFYGNTTGLGVLRPLTVPGFLSEGSFHDYQPETHRLLNADYCKLEALNFYRSYCDYFQRSLPATGEIAGWIKSEDLQINNPLFTYTNGTDDQWLPLNGARVKLMNAAGDSLTQYIIDNQYNGVFTFRNLSPGTYRLKFYHNNHFSKETTVIVTAANTTYALTKLAVLSISGNAVFTSIASGNWNNTSSWVLSSGTDVDGIPDADDNVIIKTEHNITLTSVAFCNNITLEDAGTGTRLVLGDYVLEVNGTLNADGTALSQSLITVANGKVKFVGNTRPIIGSGWSADLYAWNLEIALNAGQTGTTRTSISAANVVVSSGTLAVTGDLRPNNGTANSGTIIIENGAAISVTQRISRIATENTPFAAININGNGKLIINGTSTNALPVVNNGFPTYTFSSNALIEYQGGTQTIADISYPNLLIGAGTKTWTPAALGRTTSNIQVDGTAIFLLSGGTPVTVNGNITVAVGAIIGPASSGNRFIAGGSNRIFNLTGTARVTANETQTPAATYPFSYQYSGFASYNFAGSSWISFRSPVTDAVVQGIDGVVGSPYGNVEIVRFSSPATENTQTFTFKNQVDILGNLALVRRNDRTLMHFNFGANTIKVGGIITKDGPNTSNRDIGRTYNMGASTIELNGSSAQNTLGATDMPAAFYNLTINNATGVTPQNSITVNGTLELQKGKLTLGNNNLTVNALSGGSATSYIATTGTGKLTVSALSSTKLKIPVGIATAYYELSLTPISATVFSVRLNSGVPQAAPSSKRFYDLTCNLESSSPSATDVELTPAIPITAGTNVFAGLWNGTAYDYVTASRTGTTYKFQISNFAPFVIGESDETSQTPEVFTKLRIYAKKMMLYIAGLEQGTRIYVYDLKGQLLADIVSSNTLTTIPLKSGIYIVKVQSNENKIGQKVVVY